jgi:hypothetical protein
MKSLIKGCEPNQGVHERKKVGMHISKVTNIDRR